MKNRIIKIILIPAVGILIAGVGFFVLNSKDSKKENEKIESNDLYTDIKINYNWQIFNTAISNYPKKENSFEKYPLEIIVPHHDLAGKYLAEVMNMVESEDVDTVVIIGPNHSEGGESDIISGFNRWVLEGGSVETDISKIEKIKNKIPLTLNEELFKNEHSINALIPYVQYYFSNAKVVPLILKHNTTPDQITELVQVLDEVIGDKTIIIGSIDFSHYLPTVEADKKDLITREVLLNRDYDKLYSLNNDYIDSPATAGAVLLLSERLGLNDIQIIKNANQAEAVGLPEVESSTSYFTVILKN